MTRMRKMGKAPSMLTINRLRPKAKAKHLANARSSSVQHHHYTPETGHLIVTFRGGRRYRYEGVDQETVDGLGAAESKGSFINSRIVGRFKATPL